MTSEGPFEPELFYEEQNSTTRFGEGHIYVVVW